MEDSETRRHVADELGEIAALADPVRRSLYLFVAAQPHEVSRDEAATATGTARATVAFHLDKLVAAGLLEATYRRLTGRSGPGAGRPAKLYRRASRQYELSLPPRDYRLAADLLAQGIEAGKGGKGARVAEAARATGQRLGRDLRSGLGRRTSREARMAALADMLARHGYQPYRRGGELCLRNCPFHALAQRHRALVCGMNLALLEGVVAGLAAPDLAARPQPTPGQCCVAVGPASSAGTARGASEKDRQPRQ